MLTGVVNEAKELNATRVDRKREQIVLASLELLAEGGLGGLSLRDVAKKLDIKAPAIYWYFKSKAELVDCMAEAILSERFAGATPRTDEQTWQDWLTAYMTRLRKAMLAYPDGSRVVAGAHIHTAQTLARIFEDSLISLISAGLDQRTAAYTMMTAIYYTFGSAIEEQSAPTAETTASLNAAGFYAAYPNIASALDEYNQGADAADRAYAAGLDLIIKGAEAKAAT